MKKKISKTNAMRTLDSHKISYDFYTYDNSNNMIDGTTVANMISKESYLVYKTILTRSKNDIFVFVLPVDRELDLKKCASAVGEKNISLVQIKEINKLTGYIKGGCSPIGMKKNYTTVFDESAKKIDKIIFNAGRVGILIELKVEDISKVIDISFYDICK